MNIHSIIFLYTQSSLIHSYLASKAANTFLNTSTIYHISLYNRYSYSRHPFVKKNVIYYTFSYEKMQFSTFFLTNIIRVHYSTIQLHFKCKIRSSLSRSLSILHLSLSCAAAKQDAAIKQQHCRLRRYPSSANKQRHHY